MASRKQVLKTASEDSQNSSSRNDSSSGNNSGNNSGARKKTRPSGTVVKSRYMQTEKKPSVLKSNESILVPPRPASPKAGGVQKLRVSAAAPRRSLSVHTDQNPTSVMPSILETSSFGGNILQSTALDDHCLRPDFDLSVIKENVASPRSADPKAQKRNLELETFLLAFLTAKIEHNTHKLKEEAERNLLIMMEEEEKLRSKVMDMKRRYLLLEKQKQLNDLLDLQVTALTPLATTAKHFTEEYKVFATAVDTTRHELPVKNLHVEEDHGKFLDKAVGCLKQSQRALEKYAKDIPRDSESNAECLKEIKNTAHEVDQQLVSVSSDLLELSALVSRETVLAQQSMEEDKIGLVTAQSLFSE
ncbi:HAUS augmin-like complex subunit 8 isoform X1 [Astyanax mexicanus]|uniref:HAUS augmin-like complex subunit 8 isoform X1 n=2 Tax=Astyanax mexicanus TaxID=7994 RepID=A0A8T2LKU7_ASTMX|nr:HAUS augmin-like complex subunit 8 isoform X1 [Astyanax mexicanus]KAG9269481.1 HAUS augmin-like complex subunit 8 isoform X1 [Astyanax mexicanus]